MRRLHLARRLGRGKSRQRDKRPLFECAHEDFPGERLVACRHPQLAQRRAAQRQSLLEATAAERQKVQRRVANGRLKEREKIGLRVGQVIHQYKMAKHFVLDIDTGRFDFHLDTQKVVEQAALDGLYVLRTSVPAEDASSEETVRYYQDLRQVEAAFRSLKSDDLQIRPIYHYTEDRVRAHLFLCMLAYYVKWHMSEAWRPLLFADGDSERLARRDPVAPATRSEEALAKASTKSLDEWGSRWVVRNAGQNPKRDRPL